MINREQLKQEIDTINDNHIEILHQIILALKQPVVSSISMTKSPEMNPLKNSVLFEKDLISPIGDNWKVDQ